MVLRFTLIAIVLIGLIATGVWIWSSRVRPAQGQTAIAEAVTPASSSVASALPTSLPTPATKIVDVTTIPQIASPFRFTVTVPANWQVETIPSIEAINFYDPSADGQSTLEKSQLFIRHFSASRFLTLQTVTIHDQSELTINGRSAVRYDIEKKAGVADFPDQPAWRNSRHSVTDIRMDQGSPSRFYVIARRPELNESTYQEILQSLKEE